MKFVLKLKYLLLLVTIVWSSLCAEVRFAKIFTDHSVLQRNMAVPIWGWAEPEVEVTVEFSSQKKRTTTDKTGRWMIKLDPMNANTQGQELKATARGSSVSLKDILIGEVWLASGQSNMGFSISKSTHAESARKLIPHPTFRRFKVGSHLADKPVEDIGSTGSYQNPRWRMGGVQQWRIVDNERLDSTGSVPLPHGLAMRYGSRRVYRSGLSSLILEAQSFIAGCPANPLKIARNLPVILLSPIGIKRKSGMMRTLPGKTIQIAILTDRRQNHGSSPASIMQ